MSEKLRIICIVGDGRSGSTLLESLLNNGNDIVSVGESFRFWERFYKDETRCGCGIRITECDLWKKVDEHLTQQVPNYNVNDIKDYIHKILLYKNFGDISLVMSKCDFLISLAREFYKCISEVSGKTIIVDSSKSPAWAKLISLISEFDVRIIHIERSLPYVASSWKKKVLLPEFIEERRFMPVKSMVNIIRTWIRVKVLAYRLRKDNYLFITFEELCSNPEKVLAAISTFLGQTRDSNNTLYYKPNHAIAGNPMRIINSDKIIIEPQTKLRPDNLTRWEYYLYTCIDRLSHLLNR